MKKILKSSPKEKPPIEHLIKPGPPPDWIKDELVPRKSTQDMVDRIKLKNEIRDKKI